MNVSPSCGDELDSSEAEEYELDDDDSLWHFLFIKGHFLGRISS